MILFYSFQLVIKAFTGQLSESNEGILAWVFEEDRGRKAPEIVVWILEFNWVSFLLVGDDSRGFCLGVFKSVGPWVLLKNSILYLVIKHQYLSRIDQQSYSKICHIWKPSKSEAYWVPQWQFHITKLFHVQNCLNYFIKLLSGYL